MWFQIFYISYLFHVLIPIFGFIYFSSYYCLSCASKPVLLDLLVFRAEQIWWKHWNGVFKAALHVYWHIDVLGTWQENKGPYYPLPTKYVLCVLFPDTTWNPEIKIFIYALHHYRLGGLYAPSILAHSCFCLLWTSQREERQRIFGFSILEELLINYCQDS